MTKDRLQLREVISKPRFTVMAALAVLALSGCGDRINGSTQAIGHCGTREYDKQYGDQPVASLPKLIAKSEDDVAVLDNRAWDVGGEIPLPNDGAMALTATSNSLKLGFSRSLPDRPPYLVKETGDYVTFQTNGYTATVSPGAVACYGNNGSLYPNATYATLQLDIQETIGF